MHRGPASRKLARIILYSTITYMNYSPSRGLPELWGETCPLYGRVSCTVSCTSGAILGGKETETVYRIENLITVLKICCNGLKMKSYESAYKSRCVANLIALQTRSWRSPLRASGSANTYEDSYGLTVTCHDLFSSMLLLM